MVKIMIFGTTFGPTFHRKTTFENTVWRGYCLLMSKFCNIWNHMAPLVIVCATTLLIFLTEFRALSELSNSATQHLSNSASQLLSFSASQI